MKRFRLNNSAYGDMLISLCKKRYQCWGRGKYPSKDFLKFVPSYV